MGSSGRSYRIRWFKISCILGYLLLIIVLSFRYLITLRGQQAENSDGIQVTTAGRGGGYLSALSENNFVSFMRDFPISLFRILLSKLYKIILFDIFDRRPEWPSRPEFFKQFLRAYLGNKTVELQFRKDFEGLDIRETAGDEHNFGNARQVKWNELEFRLLPFSTWLGSFWMIAHIAIAIKLFSKFRTLVSFLYLVGFLLHLADVLNLRLSFSSMDSTWQIWIVYLLIFDLLTAVGLYFKKFWGEIFLLLVSISQLIAYTKFSETFYDQKFLVGFHVVVLTVYFILRGIEIVRAKMVTLETIADQNQ